MGITVHHNPLDDMRSATAAFFDKQLVVIGLTVKQIEEQSLEELTQSLEKINTAIENPEQFGFINYNLSAEARLIAARSDDSLFTIGVLPILLERKQLILDRLAFMEDTEKIDGIKEFIKQGVDEDVQAQLEQRLNNLLENIQTRHEQSLETEKTQQELENEQQIRWHQVQTEHFERRSKVWQTFLERESVATIVGALLLIVIVLLQAVILIFGVEMPEMLNNAFLVILGYFFGQATLRKSSSE
jgi:ABC-type Fe3+-siderophore transport system permease subunit